MTSNFDVGIELDFMKLKCSGLSKHIVDENGFPSEDPEFGNAETSNSIPDSHKLDRDIWDPLIFCRQRFNSFSIESIGDVAFINFSKPFNAVLSQETKLSNQTSDGAGGVCPTRKPEEVNFIARAPVVTKEDIRASLHQLLTT